MVITSGGAGSNVYVGILGTQCQGSGSATTTIDVYNDLFPGTDKATATVDEGKSAGLLVYTAPKPASIPGIGVPRLQFSLSLLSGGVRGRTSIFSWGKKNPFYINSQTGAITTRYPLVYTEEKEHVVRINAKAVGSGHDDCLRGGIQVTITVRPSLKCGAGQRLWSNKCIACNSFTYQTSTSHRNTACSAQPQCSYGRSKSKSKPPLGNREPAREHTLTGVLRPPPAFSLSLGAGGSLLPFHSC